MKFHEYMTIYEFVRKHDAVMNEIDSLRSREKFYDDLLKSTLVHSIEQRDGINTLHNQAVSEVMWGDISNPYYKIYPGWLPIFGKVKLDVPNEHLESPFKNFLIRFPVDHNIDILTPEPGHEIRSILVNCTRGQDVLPPEKGVTRQFTFWLDFGEVQDGMTNPDIQLPVYTFQNIKFMEDDTIETALARQMAPEKQSPDMKEGLQIPEEVLIDCTKIVVSTCFLATGADKAGAQQLLDPDVLNKHMDRFDATDDPEIKKDLHKKAKNRGKYGWTVGRQHGDISFPGIRGSAGKYDKTDRALHFSHVRSGHFHIVRYGTGKALSKVVFYAQLTVKPELPPQPSKRGYKTR